MSTLTVWKWGFAVADGAQLREIPERAQILHVGMQGSDVCLWCQVDSTRLRENRSFRVVGTGHPVDHSWKYRGTAIDGAFVWHLYETTARPI